MEMLHSRLGELNDRLQQTESRVRDNAEADAKRHAETSAAIDDVRQEARGQVRTLTIDGLREQVLGWSLIFVGTFLGGLGNLVSAVTHH